MKVVHRYRNICSNRLVTFSVGVRRHSAAVPVLPRLAAVVADNASGIR